MRKKRCQALPELEEDQTVWVRGENIEHIQKPGRSTYNHGKVDAIFVGRIDSGPKLYFNVETFKKEPFYLIVFGNSGHAFAEHIATRHILIDQPDLPHTPIIEAIAYNPYVILYHDLNDSS